MISVVLIEPKNSGNVGAIARAMANFGFSKLILINPKCNHLSQTARNRAKWANNVLSKAKIKKSLSLIKSTKIATTARLGTDYNIPRSPVTPDKLYSIIKKDAAIVFGKESSGLTNSEIQQCDFVTTIPTLKKYPVMNLSHAVSTVLYELSKQKDVEDNITSHIKFASDAEKRQIMKMLNSALKKMDFATKEKQQTQIKVWKRMIGKSFLTKREAFALMGFLRKIK